MNKKNNEFDFQPNLFGKLVDLRPLEENDFEALYKASSDPLIWEQLPRVERYKYDAFEKFFNESLELKTTLVIKDKSSNAIIGSSRYARFNKIESEIEIGWTFLQRKYWGNGFNHESKMLMINHAFKFVNSIFLVAAITNIRSRKAIEKLGATLESEIDWPPGEEVQDKSAIYRIVKGEWK